MKKFIFLTSALALAACGGGSGGVSDNLTPAQRAAVESNKNITGMLTYMSTDTFGNTINSRGAITRNSSIVYNAGSYNLEDVKFANIDEDFEDMDEDDGLQFVVNDDNKIIGFNVGLKELGPEYPKHNSTEPEFIRVDDTNKFRGYIKTNTWVDGELEYNSLGKLAGLHYSDFGNIAVKDLTTDKYAQRLTFIGGYDEAKRINADNIDEDATFTGYASGSVVSVLHGDQSGNCINLDTSKNSAADRKVATLHLENGVSTLDAKFDNWYDLTYVKSGDTKSITFENYTDSNTITDVNGNELDADEFRMISDDNSGSFTLSSIQYDIYDEDGNPTGKQSDNLNSEIRYFGDHGNPSEAVGLVQIRDKGTDPDNYDHINDYGDSTTPRPEVRMNLSFGGTK